jgi:hypothetical protein
MAAAGPNRYHHTVTSLQASGPHIPRSASASYFPTSQSQLARPKSLYSFSQNNYFGAPTYSNRSSSYIPADHDDFIEPVVPTGHKRTASNPNLRTGASGVATTPSSSSASFTASIQPDRYHRRRSQANVTTASSSSSTSASQDSSSSSTFDQSVSPSPIATPINTTASNSHYTTAIASSSSSSTSSSSQQQTLYKNPGHSQSTSAISSASSGSKKDYSSLSSVSSYSSEGTFKT